MKEKRIDGKKSYFFVFFENFSNEEKLMEKIFSEFATKHSNDSNIKILKYGNPEFEERRKEFEITRLPAFAIADQSEPYAFINFERGNYLMRKLIGEGKEFYRLISDLHYSLIDENFLRWGRTMTHARLSYLFGKVWDEVQDLINIVL